MPYAYFSLFSVHYFERSIKHMVMALILCILCMYSDCVRSKNKRGKRSLEKAVNKTQMKLDMEDAILEQYIEAETKVKEDIDAFVKSFTGIQDKVDKAKEAQKGYEVAKSEYEKEDGMDQLTGEQLMNLENTFKEKTDKVTAATKLLSHSLSEIEILGQKVTLWVKFRGQIAIN